MRQIVGFFGRIALALALVWATRTPAISGAAEVIPHAQDKPPGPALSPQEAMQKMTLPPGFHVELVAGEPDIVNPVAMTFDERGRIWITESLEYPRQAAGPGRDRVKVLEDTDGDGRADRSTIFAEGFNIPSGIAVGYGGVWLANAPDILFLQDTDGDGRADKQEVVVTGFGRDDTHELPNSLTWGPDGWLYGLNGVFNRSQVSQGDRHFDFTCALFRIHPRTREFQLFAEGTSNPWGVAWDGEGSAFVSACVIDHLWHLAESGYYVRQGGPYPPFTQPMRSIVRHKHQKAAYCGIHFFDSDAYPSEYRERLYMGNIHGGAINVDVLARSGSTYSGATAPDFLEANDAWFMPVVQKTGPDGCLYVLDWYDRYHCYQDACRDPEGIDRLKGRLYRIRYQDTPRAAPFDLAAENDARLIERLGNPNVFYRDLAQRILCERNDPETRPKLERMIVDDSVPRKARMHALWALVGGGPLPVEFHLALLANEDAGFRAWGIRAAGNAKHVDLTVAKKIVSLAHDPAADVRLQVAIAARKLDGVDAMPLLLDVLARSGDDPLIPHIVWQNLHPLVEQNSEQLFELLAREEYRKLPALNAMMPRLVDRVLACREPAPIVALVHRLFDNAGTDPAAMQKCLAALTARLQNHEIPADQMTALRPDLEKVVAKILDGPADSPLHADAALLAATWKEDRALKAARELYASPKQPLERRFQALRALVAARDPSLEPSMRELLAKPDAYPTELRITALDYLSDLDAPWVGQVVLANFPSFEVPLRAPAIELLVKRRVWVEQLLDAIGRGEIPAAALNSNQVRDLLVRADEALAEKVRKHWGTFRSERDPTREEVIARMRSFLRRTPGDPAAGQAVFKRVCGECHKLYGEGQDVGPDITVNGRSSFELLLSNVFDPSLVIGAAYQAQTVVTGDGRVLTGLTVEDSPQHIVLKTQGGKLETIAKDDVEARRTSALSLMPEGLEKQIKPQELSDLFALLALDKPPNDPAAKIFVGYQPPPIKESNRPAQFRVMVGEVAPGFGTLACGKPGLAIVAEHAGRPYVLRTRPISESEPCVLARTIDLPKDRPARLLVSVSHETKGCWNLAIAADGKELKQQSVGGANAEAGWQTLTIDLSALAGRTVTVELANGSAGNALDTAYWGGVEIVFD